MPTLTPTLRPEPKQHSAWQKLRDLVTSFIVFGGGAGGGKTWLGCEWLLTNCYLYPGSRWFIVPPAGWRSTPRSTGLTQAPTS